MTLPNFQFSVTSIVHRITFRALVALYPFHVPSSLPNTMTSLLQDTMVADWIDAIDSMSPTQLYGIIVGLTVVACGFSMVLTEQPEINGSAFLQSQERSVRSKKGGREPRWHIFRWVNGIVLIVFCSAAYYCMRHSESNMLAALLGWSALLCYFFGFFGVSFVHDVLEEEDAGIARYVAGDFLRKRIWLLNLSRSDVCLQQHSRSSPCSVYSSYLC